MGLFSGIKTIKKSTPVEPEKVESAPDSTPKGFNSSTAHGLYDPKLKPDSTPIATSGEIATVGDGGASWKRRALLRAKQKADMSGKSLNEVVTDLHGTSVKEMASDSKGAYEKWKGPRKSYKPRDEGGEEERGAARRESNGREEVRGGGLRLGRNSSDADVLKRFKSKVSDGFKRSGLSSSTKQVEDNRSRRSNDHPSNVSNKKREREPESEVWDKSKFEEILKQSEREEEDQKRRQRMKTEDIWDAPVDDTAVPFVTPHQKLPSESVGGNLSVAAAMRARLSTPNEAPQTGDVNSSNLSVAAAMRARLSTPNEAPQTGDVNSSNLSAAAAMRARLSKTPTDREGDSHPQMLAPLDREGRRLLALLEPDRSLDGSLQKEDFKRGKWRGKAKGDAAAAGGEEGAKRMDITTMAAFEREGGEDMDEVFARNISRLGGRFKGTEDKAGSRAGMDEEEDIDMKMYQNVNERVTSNRLIEIQKNKAVAEERRYSSMVSHSPFSVENPHFKHRLVIARGLHSFVMLLEKKKRLVPGHCYIVALQQAPSSRAVQEEVWDEMCNFKKSLRRYFGSQGQGALFLETALIKSGRAWANIECLPVPLDCEEDAPLYFKQSLSAAESEWSTHRAIIDTARGLRKSIPTGFPYFHVEWARGGCAHIIEDVEEFGADFGISVVAGMIEVDHHITGSSAQESEAEIEKFKTSFAPFNPIARN